MPAGLDLDARGHRFRAALVVFLIAGIAFVAGYILGQGPRWALWEMQGNRVLGPTTESFATRRGCDRARDARNKVEEAKTQREAEEWRKNNPNPTGLARVLGPITSALSYECYPVGVNLGRRLIR